MDELKVFFFLECLYFSKKTGSSVELPKPVEFGGRIKKILIGEVEVWIASFLIPLIFDIICYPLFYMADPAKCRWEVVHKAKTILKSDSEALHMEQNYFLESFVKLSFHENNF